nr:Hypothetical protein [synthetic construct]
MTDQQNRIRALLEAAGFTPDDAAQLAADVDPAALLADLDDISYLENAEQHEEISHRPRPKHLN